MGWMPAPQNEWERAFQGFSLRAGSIFGLDGGWLLSHRFEVLYNEQPVTVRSAVLRTADKEYAGEIDERVIHVPPQGGAFAVSWLFDEQHRLPEVLGDSATIILQFLVGSMPQEARVEYKRSRCR
jgi:hypothetical protein